jgi:hypothetical protein
VRGELVGGEFEHFFIFFVLWLSNIYDFFFSKYFCIIKNGYLNEFNDFVGFVRLRI